MTAQILLEGRLSEVWKVKWRHYVIGVVRGLGALFNSETPFSSSLVHFEKSQPRKGSEVPMWGKQKDPLDELWAPSTPHSITAALYPLLS